MSAPIALSTPMPLGARPSPAPRPEAGASLPAPAAPTVAPPKPVQLNINPEEERRQVQEAVAMLNQQVSKHQMGLGFHVDEALGGPVVTVRNTASGEVIRQIPNEVVVKFAHHLDSLKGLLHNDRA